jgi:hypothetical protein
MDEIHGAPLRSNPRSAENPRQVDSDLEWVSLKRSPIDRLRASGEFH